MLLKALIFAIISATVAFPTHPAKDLRELKLALVIRDTLLPHDLYILIATMIISIICPLEHTPSCTKITAT